MKNYITDRQTLQSLAKVVSATNVYNQTIREHVAALDLSKYKTNQQSLLKKRHSRPVKKLT